jgi:ankyrin repeat protein
MMEFDSLIDAIRENDFGSFAAQVRAIDDPANFAIANNSRYANWFSGLGATLLQLTSFVRPEFAPVLLEQGVAVDLHSACALGDVESVKRLLSDDPDSIKREVDTYLPIQFALRHPPALRILLQQGEHARRAIKKLAWFEWEDQAAERGLSNWRPIHMLALGRGDEPHIVTAELLREFGADLSETSSPFGEAPVHVAATYNRTHLLRWFADQGCDVNTPTADTGYNPATLNLFDAVPFAPFYTSGQTPLMIALGEGHAEAVHVLLELGASVNVVDSSGFTPLHYASAPYWQENPAHVTLMIEAGADVSAVSSDGRSPLDLAEQRGYDAAVSLLSSHRG